jgi:hypothetical protein
MSFPALKPTISIVRQGTKAHRSSRASRSFVLDGFWRYRDGIKKPLHRHFAGSGFFIGYCSATDGCFFYCGRLFISSETFYVKDE